MGYGGIDVDDLNEERAERDAARAQLAEVTRERDEARAGMNERHRAVVAERDALEASLIEARAKVAGLTLPEDTIKTLLGALGEGVAPRGPRCFTSRYADACDDLTRYAETLGGA